MIARHRAASRPIIECSEALVSVRDPFAAVVLHGRRHVRPVLRDTADATFARRHGRKAYEQLARIVDEYVAIDDRGRTNRMMSLTGHFARFLTDLGIVESCASA